MAQTYTELLLNDGSAPDSHSDSLYRVLILMARPIALLKDGSAPDGRSYSIYLVLTLWHRPIRSHS